MVKSMCQSDWVMGAQIKHCFLGAYNAVPEFPGLQIPMVSGPVGIIQSIKFLNRMKCRGNNSLILLSCMLDKEHA